MKIGINARFMAQPYTGIGQYTRAMLRALAEVDTANEYFLFTPELPDWDGAPLPDRFHFIRVPEAKRHSPSMVKAHWEHVLVPQEFEKWHIDLAHFLYPANPWRRLKIPTIVTVHDVIPWRLPAYNRRLRSKLYHFYVKHALKKADHLITVSDFSKQEIQQVFKTPAKNITVIPHGVPLSVPPAPATPLRRDYFLYAGGYDFRKNIPLLINAYLKYIANDHAVDLILVNGKGRGLQSLIDDRFAKRVAAHIPVQPKGSIVFTDALSNDELYALYQQALAFVHPSFYEGFNLPLLEALFFGCPIAAADIPVNHEVSHDAVLFVNPQSADSIGDGMLQLIQNEALRDRLGKKAVAAAKNYRWKSSAEKVLSVYNLFT